MKIAVDVMGADHGPEPIVRGAIEAVEAFACDVVLVGDEAAINPLIEKYCSPQLRAKVSVQAATEVITMQEQPGVAVRKKKDASIGVATRLVKEGTCQAVVSACSTGAAVAAALFGLGRLPGIERPAIATPLPNLIGTTVVLDSGANVDSKPQHMAQSAIMGSIYAEYVLGVKSPRVGLLSIGEEPNKGNEQTLATYPLLEKMSAIRFIGNVEGRDIPKGTVDVVVCDGFIGNVVLKFGEGLASAIMHLIKDAIHKAGWLAKLASVLILPALRSLKKKLDPSEYGGAPLLGVNGGFIICHGSSQAKAIKNAVRVAKEFTEEKVLEHIRESIEREEGKNP